MAARAFAPGHNILVSLDTSERGAERFTEILTFLARSRIRYAITESPPLSQSILTQFWENIQYDAAANPPVVRTRVNQHPVVFSADDLRQILRFGTVEQEAGPSAYSTDFIEGALGRMGYSGPRRGRQFIKAFILGQWRFLFHIIVTIFGNKKGGYDELSPQLFSGLLSLVYNKPYSFSSYIFSSFIGQITGAVRSKFLIYPRFCMLIIRHCIPDMPAVDPDLFVDRVNLRTYNACFLTSSRRPDGVKPEAVDLFGYLLDENYVAPANDGWLDVAPAADVPEPVADVVRPEDPQELLEDVLEHPGPQVDPEVAAQVVQEVLVQHDDATDPVLQAIEHYVAPVEVYSITI